jgi:hypothetical protein
VKVNVDLGVSSKKDLMDPRSCFQIGQSVRRLEDVVVFSSFLVGEGTKGRAFSSSELELISAGILTAANYAAYHLHHAIPSKRDEIGKLASSAKNLNNKIRSFLSIPKDGVKPTSINAEESKRISSSVSKLVERVQTFSNDVEKLCYVERKQLAGYGRDSRIAMGSARSVSVTARPSSQATGLKKNVFPAFSRPAFRKSIRRRP